jgi:hypothetical protein
MLLTEVSLSPPKQGENSPKADFAPLIPEPERGIYAAHRSEVFGTKNVEAA